MNSLRSRAFAALVASARTAALRPQTPLRLQAASLKTYNTRSLLATRAFSQSARVARESSSENAENVGEDVSAAVDADSAQPPPTASSAVAEEGHGIFIRNIVFDANETHLREAFEKFGAIENVVISKDSRGLSRGYGFVWFKDADAAEAAIRETDSTFWHGRRIYVTKRSPKTAGSSSKGPTKSIFIGNIPYETTDADLNKLFSDIQGVTDVRVAVDRTTGWPRGFAHADFVDVESATKAVEVLRDHDLNGRHLRVDFASEGRGGLGMNSARR